MQKSKITRRKYFVICYTVKQKYDFCIDFCIDDASHYAIMTEYSIHFCTTFDSNVLGGLEIGTLSNLTTLTLSTIALGCFRNQCQIYCNRCSFALCFETSRLTSRKKDISKLDLKFIRKGGLRRSHSIQHKQRTADSLSYQRKQTVRTLI